MGDRVATTSSDTTLSHSNTSDQTVLHLEYYLVQVRQGCPEGCRAYGNKDLENKVVWMMEMT